MNAQKPQTELDHLRSDFLKIGYNYEDATEAAVNVVVQDEIEGTNETTI